MTQTIATTNPATGEMVKKFTPLTGQQLEKKLETASKAFHSFKLTSFQERAEKMHRLGDILKSEKRTLGLLMTLEMGKTLSSAIQEIEKCSLTCHYFADHAEKFLANEKIPSDTAFSYVQYQPLGPILGIMPWNFPFWQVIRFAVPSIMAGNVALLKHAPNVPQCALKIEELFREAQYPDGVFQTLLIDIQATEKVIEDSRVRAVSLTGSVRAGSSVGCIAGRAIKKIVLELGGSDPFIIMPSADRERAVEVGIKSRCLNNGQSCIAAKRFIVHEKIYDAFTKAFVAGIKDLKVGDPMDEKTAIGPIARSDLCDQLEHQVQKSLQMGAKALTGGNRLKGPGYFFEPTVLVDIPHTAPAYHEELFGPVASLFRVKNIDEAIELANSTEFGLGSAAWTNDIEEKKRFANELEAGSVFINSMVASDAKLPFGGIKHSGYGRELSRHGIREFTNIKTVCIKDL